jgi:ABC-type transport system substrate-binding protein
LLASEPALQIADLRGRPEIAVETSPGTAMEHLNFNTAHPGHPLLRERWFRQAVAFALDREALFPLLYGSISPDFGAHHNVSYPRTHENYVPSFARYAYSPETAEDIMRRTGCIRGDNGIYSCGGISASVRFSTTTGNPRRALHSRPFSNSSRASGSSSCLGSKPPGRCSEPRFRRGTTT